MGHIRILIADDHALVRQGTIHLLKDDSEIEVVAEADDGEAAVELAAKYKPDVALVDIAMPKLDGIEVTSQIKALCPETKVLILSAYDEDQFVFRLIEAGADGYLLKNIHSHELIEAIRALYLGDSVLHPSIARKVVGHLSSNNKKHKGKEPLKVLTEREEQILKLIMQGSSNKEIAAKLGLSTRTVEGHMAQTFNKLGVNTRIGAMVYALKEGWVSIDDITPGIRKM